jgi:Tfp pilus assembly PilM family ATPase
MKTKRFLGVSFYDNRLQFVEVEVGKKPTVHALAEQDTTLDFSSDAVSLSAEHPKVSSLASEISALITRTNASAKDISFALPTRPSFITTMPVDPSLKDDELKEYLKWEVRQYFPDAGPKDFITDSYVLPSKQKDARLTFVVAVRRGMVAFLQKVASQLQLSLHIVDIDHFSTEKALIANYPEIKKEAVALIGVQHSGVDASIVKNHEMVDYRGYAGDPTSSLGTTIAQYLQYVKQKDEVGAIACIYLHGSHVPIDVLPTLSSETGVETVSLNAFHTLTAAESVDKALAAESHRFAAAIGVALRGS